MELALKSDCRFARLRTQPLCNANTVGAVYCYDLSDVRPSTFFTSSLTLEELMIVSVEVAGLR